MQLDPATGQMRLADVIGKKYTKEWHVSVNDGDDTTGDGSALRPYKTIAKALTVVGNTGEVLFIHAGTYPENVTFTKLNVDIVGQQIRSGLVNLTGNWVFGHTNSSNRAVGLSFAGVTHSSGGNLYMYNCSASGAVNKSGGGYFEANNCEMQDDGISITGSGLSNFFGGKLFGLLVSSGSAVVTIKDCQNATQVTNQAGVLNVNNSIVFSTSTTDYALSSSAYGMTMLSNSQFYDSTGADGILLLNGTYGMDNICFDRSRSTLSGQALGKTAWFDNIALPAIQDFGSSTILGVDDSGTFGRVRGAITLNGANASANGVGISFPAVQQSSSDPNTLDDYEEGTWTPVCNTANITVGAVYSSSYVKIGGAVHAWCHIAVNNTGSDAAGVVFGGLPFFCRNYGHVSRLHPPKLYPAAHMYAELNSSIFLDGTGYPSGVSVSIYYVCYVAG